MEDIVVCTSVLLGNFYQRALSESRYRLHVIYRYQTIVGVHCWVIKVACCVANNYSMRRLTPALLPLRSLTNIYE